MFDSTWAAIKKRYDNKREIALRHVKKIFQLQKINDVNAGALHVLIDTSRSVYQALEGQGLSEKEKYEIFFFNARRGKLQLNPIHN